MSQADYDPQEEEKGGLTRLWEFLLGPHETQRKVTLRLILVILLTQGAFELRETAWGTELLDVLGEALDRVNNDVAQIESVIVGNASATPQGLLDIENLNFQLGNKSAENEALRQELALAQQAAAQARAALSVARAGMDSAVNTCITQEELPDENQICINRADYDARVSRFYGSVLDGGVTAEPQ